MIIKKMLTIQTYILTYPAPASCSVQTETGKWRWAKWTLRKVIKARLAGCWFHPGRSHFDSKTTHEVAFMPLALLQQDLNEVKQQGVTNEVASDK